MFQSYTGGRVKRFGLARMNHLPENKPSRIEYVEKLTIKHDEKTGQVAMVLKFTEKSADAIKFCTAAAAYTSLGAMEQHKKTDLHVREVWA